MSRVAGHRVQRREADDVALGIGKERERDDVRHDGQWDDDPPAGLLDAVEVGLRIVDGDVEGHAVRVRSVTDPAGDAAVAAGIDDRVWLPSLQRLHLPAEMSVRRSRAARRSCVR